MTTLTVVLAAAVLVVAATAGLVVAALVIEARAIDRAGDALGDGDAFHLTPREWDQIQSAHDSGPGVTSPAPGPDRLNGEGS